LCDWNGLMIASFSFAGRVLGEARYTQAALKAADFILTHMKAGDRLLHRWREGQAGISATLEDYAFFIYGLLGTYEASFQGKYLDEARLLADEMIELFGDEAGGFYMTAIDAEKLIMRPKEVYDGALPSGNSVAALALLKLHALTQKDLYLSKLQALFSCFSPMVARAPHAHCFLLSAMDWHLQGALEITFQGPENDGDIAQMLKVLYKHFIPSKTVKRVIHDEKAQAYICSRGTCRPPVEDPDVFENEILRKGRTL